MKKFLSLALAVLMLFGCVARLASCGNDEIENDENTFIVVTNCPFEPLEYVGDDGKLYGIDIEIAKGYADSRGLTLVIKNGLVIRSNSQVICNFLSFFPIKPFYHRSIPNAILYFGFLVTVYPGNCPGIIKNL